MLIFKEKKSAYYLLKQQFFSLTQIVHLDISVEFEYFFIQQMPLKNLQGIDCYRDFIKLNLSLTEEIRDISSTFT